MFEACKGVFCLRKENRDEHWKDNPNQKSSAGLLVSLLLEFKFGSLQYKGLADKELTDDLKVIPNCKWKRRQR